MPEIREGYFANLKNYPVDEEFIVVSRKYPWFLKKGLLHHPVLAPSVELLHDWKHVGISWEEYKKRFREEMYSTESKQMIDDLAWASQYHTFRLLCYEKNPPCHRFILIDMINESLNEYNKNFVDEEFQSSASLETEK